MHTHSFRDIIARFRFPLAVHLLIYAHDLAYRDSPALAQRIDAALDAAIEHYKLA